VEIDDGGQVDVSEDVATDDEKGIIQLGHGVANRPGGTERGLFGGVDHADAELGAVAEIGADGVGLEGHGHHDVVEAVLFQQAHDVLHHGPVGQRHHGLGRVGGQRTQAGPLPAGHDDGFHEWVSWRPSMSACLAIGM
jgi:hypothetical protein